MYGRRACGGWRAHACHAVVSARDYVRLAIVCACGVLVIRSRVGGCRFGGWVFIGHRSAVGGCTLYLRCMCGRVIVGRLCVWVVGGDVHGTLLVLL